MSADEQTVGVVPTITGSLRWCREAARRLFTFRGQEEPPPVSEEVERAWIELKSHPKLVWIPPIWRGEDGDEHARRVGIRHGVSAVEHNLLIDIVVREHRRCFRLATGPLHDRPAPGGVDPVAPAGEMEPKLDVTGATFEEALLRLHEAVLSVYGPLNDERRPALHESESVPHAEPATLRPTPRAVLREAAEA